MHAHVTYDSRRERWAFAFDSYWGGDRYRNPSAPTIGTASLRWTDETPSGESRTTEAKRPSYLVPHRGESDYDFDQRHALAGYLNLVAPIVKAYAEGVTGHVQRDLGPLAEYAADVTRRGTAWGSYASEAARWAALYGLVFNVTDAPAGKAPATEAERAAKKWAPYCLLVHPPAVAWLVADPSGRLVEFAYADAPYQSQDEGALASTCEVTVRVWTADTVDEKGARTKGRWSVRKGTVMLSESIGRQRGRLEEVDGGDLPEALGGEIPVDVLYYERDTSVPYPMGSAVVSDAVDLARLIYNRLSWIDEIHRKSAFPFLAIPLKQQGGQMDAQTAVKIGPGKGLGYDGGAGAPQWIQPSSDSSRELRDHCLFLFQLALRSAGLEVAADSSAQVSSGQALRIRSRDFESRAASFGTNCEAFERAVLRRLSLLAGTDPEAPKVAYPNRYTLPDPSEDLANALAVLKDVPVEIGRTARLAAVRKALEAALSLSDEDMAKALEEVEAVLDEDAKAFAQHRAVENAKRDDELTALRSKAKPPPHAPMEPMPPAEGAPEDDDDGEQPGR